MRQGKADRIIRRIGALAFDGDKFDHLKAVPDMPLPRRANGIGIDERMVPPIQANRAESQFVHALMERHQSAIPIRHGWPDFLIRDGGKTYAVEVKHELDVVSARQRVMFEALEAAGIKVYIWHTSKPNALTPWRKYAVRTRTRSTRERDANAFGQKWDAADRGRQPA